MKFLLILVISVAVSTQALAQETTTDKMVDKCVGFTDMAKSAVQARQKRIPASHMYKALINQDKDTQAMIRFALDEAYKTPLAKSEEEKEPIILEFTNRIFSDCMKYFTEKYAK